MAGSGISGCGPAIGLAADITDRASIRAMLDEAGARLRRLRRASPSPPASSSPPDTTGRIPDDKWARTFAINVTGSYLVADEAGRIWQAQQGCPAASC